jgi:glycogen debranching enzyme
MAPRLQGELAPDGALSLDLWGLGAAGRLRLAAWDGPLVVGPNRIEAAAGGGLWVAQSAPALAVKGPRPEAEADGRLVIQARGEGAWIVAAGATDAELARALALGASDIVREAGDYVGRCDLSPASEPLLRSLVMQGAHAALSSIRQDDQGRFAGLAAGLIYSNPPRTYYRDGYWTLQLLLRTAPDVVAAEIELLARQVQPDGEAPSAVILACPAADAFEQSRLAREAMAAVHWRPGEWWSDHFDSPLFFVLAIADLAAASGDDSLARRHWPAIAAIFRRYLALRGPEGLPVKPHNDRDWADNVYRDGLVAYDLGLWVGALDALARLGAAIDAALAAQAQAEAVAARAAIERTLWRDGAYVDYLRPDGWAETHLALDALTLLRYDAVAAGRAEAMLAAISARLESRHNAEQPYGDFGMLCAWPPFADHAALRAKSADPYRYHNGGEWPWLDALCAAERLRRGLPGWRYPLTRWWSQCLAQGWAGAVEHYSVPYGRGSLLQGWSSFPAAVVLAYADRVLAGDPET